MTRSVKPITWTVLSSLLMIFIFPVLSGCGNSTANTAATTATTTTPTPTVLPTSLLLSATPATVNSDNSTTATVTVTAISSANVPVPGVVVNLSTDTGLVNNASVTTDATGKGTFTFMSGSLNNSTGNIDKSNRTATITATAGTITAQYPIQIQGSTATITSTANNLPDNGTLPATITVIAKDSAGTVVPRVSVVMNQASTNNGKVSFAPASGVTDTKGSFTTTVTGVTAGSATVSAATLGATANSVFTVTPTAATFGITSTVNGATTTTNPTSVAMKIGDALVVNVNAPGATQVRFTTTMGGWNTATLSPSATVVNVVNGVAQATLTTTQAGVASVYIDNPASPTSNASLSVSMTATTPVKITLQATPSLLSKSVGTTNGVATLIATVTDASNKPVGDASVAFSIVNPTGGGETVLPALTKTASTITSNLGLGQASTSFTSGSMSSSQSGVQIRAQVLGTNVATCPVPVNGVTQPCATASGNDATVVIGGTAGSIAFGQATVATESPTKTNYILPMSVLVADSNGNPAPAGTVVSLSLWPIAWSTGTGCVPDPDGQSWDPVNNKFIVGNGGTFFNEDANENLILDQGEDGYRKYYSSGTVIPQIPDPSPTAAPGAMINPGTIDGLITPPNSAAGTVPATVTTDATGLATFSLTYNKTSAIWIVARIRARTQVQGSETLSERKFRLPALLADTQPCVLPPSSYKF